MKYFKIHVKRLNGEILLTLKFSTILEMRLAYEILQSSITTTSYIQTLALDDSGNWNGYEID